MKTTRQQIIEHIQARGTSTASELSRALRVTPANVRRHLSILLAEGAIQPDGELPGPARGRPARLYSLTRQAGEHNLDRLASALLDELLENRPDPERAAILGRIARRMQPPVAKLPAGLTQRLNNAVQQLNQQHYKARWEAHAAAPHLILGRCPYLAILPEHPELCLLETFHLASLVGASVEQTARLAHDGRGGTFCRFVVRRKS